MIHLNVIVLQHAIIVNFAGLCFRYFPFAVQFALQQIAMKKAFAVDVLVDLTHGIDQHFWYKSIFGLPSLFNSYYIQRVDLHIRLSY